MNKFQLENLIDTLGHLTKTELIDVVCELTDIGITQEMVRLSDGGVPYHYHTGEALTDRLDELMREEGD